MRGIKPRDPMKTRNGRTRLGPLNAVQIEELIAKSSSNKEKDRLRQRLVQLKSRKTVDSVVEAE